MELIEICVSGTFPLCEMEIVRAIPLPVTVIVPVRAEVEVL